MRICFVLPSVSIGGGSYAILQHADYLSEQGNEVFIVTSSPVDADAMAWHPSLSLLGCLSVEDALHAAFDVAVATFWTTVEVALLLNAKHRVYFVQSIESLFYPRRRTELRSAVNATYALSLPVITVAGWMKDRLEREYDSRVWLARNGIDKSIFSTHGPLAAPRRTQGLRVLVEGPLGVEFKNVPQSVRAARLAQAADVWLLTSSPIDSYPGVDRVFSRVPMARTADIYRSCDVLLKLSLVEGFGLPPLEMFCCGGTAVVYMVGGIGEYVRPGTNALACDVHDLSAVDDALRRLQSDAHLLARLRTQATATGARWPDWTIASARFAECLGEIVELPRREPDRPPLQSAHKPPQRPTRTRSTQLQKWKQGARSLPWLRRVIASMRVQWWAHFASRRTPRGYGD
jgi:O-antigen biosynthesis protein